MRPLLCTLFLLGLARAQQPAPQTPPASAPAKLRLEDLEQMALRRNPSLAQARAATQSARGLQRQAGLYPNPVIGYTGDEINNGPTYRGGEHGGFIEQRILTAGKRGIARSLAEQDVNVALADADAQRYRVLNTTRMLFYQALGEQRLIEVRTQLAQLARRAVQTTSELQNVGQADRPDVLAVDIEAQRLELGLTLARNALERTWRQLAAVTGNTSLAPAPLDGNLEEIPKLDFNTELARVTQESPEIRTAQVGATRTTLAVREAQAAVKPDLILRSGLHYSRELLELNRRPIGLMGSAEVAVSLPLFNRNQGAIAAARADAERASLSVERAQLDLRRRLADAFREYQDAMAASERYRTVMIPRAQEAYNLYQNSFRQMAAAYPQVIITQRNLFQLQEDYVATLISAWQRVVEIQGLLLTEDTGGISGAARGGTARPRGGPGDGDR